ncbi:MAG: peptide chain release factor N(5)-glutamine methyltransferase [Eubacteriaceae bacterium]
MEIKKLLENGRKSLSQSGIVNSGFEAELLLAEILKCDRVYFYTHGFDNVSSESVIEYQNMIDRRCLHEPIAYIIEKKEFMGLSFTVNPNVLIPRPDTEPMIEYLLDLLKEKFSQGSKILDLCTGSGCIGISIKKYYPQGEVLLSDLSPRALEIAKINGDHLVSGKVGYLESDLFEELSEGNKFELIVSNPPYIKRNDIKELMKDVLDYEPKLALDGGETGLDFYKRIIKDGKKYLKENGYLALEIGDDQEQEIEEILVFNGYFNIKRMKDLSGKVRCLIGESAP